jgi:hypothetical protein
MAGKAVLTADELAQAEQRARDRANVDQRDGTDAGVDLGRAFNEFWHTRRPTILMRRTSLITDPPDGKLPPLTHEAEQRRTATIAARRNPDRTGTVVAAQIIIVARPLRNRNPRFNICI